MYEFSMFVGDEKLSSSTLLIENMDRHKGGTYICTANNGVGQPASAQVVLHVLCKYNFGFCTFLYAVWLRWIVLVLNVLSYGRMSEYYI